MRNLDEAQRLSLIQRNLEAAQLAIDNAYDILRVVLEASFDGQVSAEPPVRRSRPKKEVEVSTPPRKASHHKKKVGVAPGQMIAEFLAFHTKDFSWADVATWAKKKGYQYNKKSAQQTLYAMANAGKKLVSIEKGSGQYRKAEAA